MSLLQFLQGGENAEKKFSEAVTVSLPSSAVGRSRRNSFSDAAHKAKVKNKTAGLTLMRCRCEKLKANNPPACEAMLKAWNLRVKAIGAYGSRYIDNELLNFPDCAFFRIRLP